MNAMANTKTLINSTTTTFWCRATNALMQGNKQASNAEHTV